MKQPPKLRGKRVARPPDAGATTTVSMPTDMTSFQPAESVPDSSVTRISNQEISETAEQQTDALPVKPPSRSKGRPKKTTLGKGNYSKLLISQKVLNSVYRLAHVSLLTSGQIYERFKLITADEKTAEYYWRLVYTISFYQYRDLQILSEASENDQKPDIKKYTLRNFSKDVDIAYFNLKRMFEGRGITKNYISYYTFLHIHGINFVQIQLDPGVIEKAYSYYSILQDHPLDEMTMHKLFY